MATVEEMLKNLLEQQKFFAQQIADQNQKINQVMDQMKEMEKRKGSTEIPNFVLVNDAETGEIGHSGNRVSGEGQSKGNIMHFNPRVEFPAFDGSNPRLS